MSEGGGGGSEDGGPGGGGGSEFDGGGGGVEVVARVDQPPDRKPRPPAADGGGGAGAEEGGGGGGLTACQLDDRGTLGGAGVETVAHPPPFDEDAEPDGVGWVGAEEIEAQLDFLKPLLSPLFSMLSLVLVLGTAASFMPAALASLRSSFSSRLRSFSLRRSASSRPPIRSGWLAFISFSRAL